MFAWGNRDRFVSRAAAELCGRYVTGPYRFTELDGASHWLPEQASGQVAALLAEHFAAVKPNALRNCSPDVLTGRAECYGRSACSAHAVGQQLGP
jgi:hypothetical protein